MLVAAFQHSLCKASTATCPSRHSHLCPAVSPTLPFLCSDPGLGETHNFMLAISGAKETLQSKDSATIPEMVLAAAMFA